MPRFLPELRHGYIRGPDHAITMAVVLASLQVLTAQRARAARGADVAINQTMFKKPMIRFLVAKVRLWPSFAISEENGAEVSSLYRAIERLSRARAKRQRCRSRNSIGISSEVSFQ
jgi:hypothetical protein